MLKSKKKKSTKPYKPSEGDRDTVRRLVVAGWKAKEIHSSLGICFNTYKKHFEIEIATAKAILTSKAVKVLEAHLNEENLDAAKFYLERKAGWNAKQEITTRDGGQAPDDEIEKAREILQDEEED